MLRICVCGGIVHRHVVQKNSSVGALVIPPNPGAAVRPFHHDGDAVELFMAGMEDVTGHY